MSHECPHCAQKYKLPKSRYGKRFDCKKCSKRIVFYNPKEKYVEFCCDACSQKYSVRESLSGKSMTCKKCQKKMTVPERKKFPFLLVAMGMLIVIGAVVGLVTLANKQPVEPPKAVAPIKSANDVIFPEPMPATEEALDPFGQENTEGGHEDVAQPEEVSPVEGNSEATDPLDPLDPFAEE